MPVFQIVIREVDKNYKPIRSRMKTIHSPDSCEILLSKALKAIESFALK